VTILGLFLTPVFYVVISTLTHRIAHVRRPSVPVAAPAEGN
jgi:hypothetical protein